MREIVQLGDPVLRRPATPVGTLDGHEALVDEMVATLSGRGVGLAAPQIGVSLRIAVVEDPAELQAAVPPALLAAQDRRPVDRQVLADPVLTPVGDERALFFEGCLSFSGWMMLVERHVSVRCEAVGREPFVATGWHARILQHECDHLDGVLCVDHTDTRSIVSVESYRARWAHLPVEEAARQLGLGLGR